jgi:hypothetical protein
VTNGNVRSPTRAKLARLEPRRQLFLFVSIGQGLSYSSTCSGVTPRGGRGQNEVMIVLVLVDGYEAHRRKAAFG